MGTISGVKQYAMHRSIQNKTQTIVIHGMINEDISMICQMWRSHEREREREREREELIQIKNRRR